MIENVKRLIMERNKITESANVIYSPSILDMNIDEYWMEAVVKHIPVKWQTIDREILIDRFIKIRGPKDIPHSTCFIKKGTRLTNVYSFAGKNAVRGTPLNPGVLKAYMNQYGGSPDEWFHAVGDGTILLDNVEWRGKAEIHWFECNEIGAVGIEVKMLAPVDIQPTSLSNGKVGTEYRQSFRARGTPVLVWKKSSGDLPPGLKLSWQGTLQGTPSAIGTYAFTVEVSNQKGSSSIETSMTVDN